MIQQADMPCLTPALIREKTPWTIRPQPVEFPPCMKSSLLRTFFEWALITSVLMSVGFLTWYCLKSRAIRATNSQISRTQFDIQKNRAVIGMLLAECQAYGKTN